MFKLKIETKQGLLITLTQNESKYVVTNIEGLNPPQADVFTSAIANMHGGKYKNSKVQMRNLVITVAIRGDVEENRLELYRIFHSGEYCKIYYENGLRNVYIEGYAESIESNPFSIAEQMQISIICPQPFWVAAKKMIVDISKEIGAFEFPFAIESEGIEFSYIELDKVVPIVNYGEIESGIIIRINCYENGVNNLKIIHENKSTYFTIATTLNNGDEVVINTKRGQKSITINGQSAMNVVGLGSTWFSLAVGDNTFSYSADSSPEAVAIVFEFEELYEGV